MKTVYIPDAPPTDKVSVHELDESKPLLVKHKNYDEWGFLVDAKITWYLVWPFRNECMELGWENYSLNRVVKALIEGGCEIQQCRDTREAAEYIVIQESGEAYDD